MIWNPLGWRWELRRPPSIPGSTSGQSEFVGETSLAARRRGSRNSIPEESVRQSDRPWAVARPDETIRHKRVDPGRNAGDEIMLEAGQTRIVDHKSCGSRARAVGFIGNVEEFDEDTRVTRPVRE